VAGGASVPSPANRSISRLVTVGATTASPEATTRTADTRSAAGQFLAEAVLLSLGGGTAGVLIGVAVTAGVARAHGWAFGIPAIALWGCLGTAVVVGALAGCCPALRAAWLPPAEALRTG